MHYKRIVWILASISVVLLTANTIYYTLYPNQVSIDATKLSVVDEQTGNLRLIDKDSDEGKLIVSKLYGSYADIIHAKPLLLVSTPSAAEFTVPQIDYRGKGQVVREHPNLRYELWQQESPDVILLGSSIFFCDFNREMFFQNYPDKKLLDFTTGNNTPYIAHYFMQRVDSMRLPFKPGSIALYGLNRVEMLEGYKSKSTHNFVKQALNSKMPELNLDEQIATMFKIPELRYDLTNGLKRTYDDVFRSGNVYRKCVDKKHIKNEASFIEYQQSVAPIYNGRKTFDRKRIEEIQQLATLLEKYDCHLVLLKLPQSLYNDLAMNTVGNSYFDTAIQQIKSDNISYIDVSDFEKYNIKQTDYLWPGNIFDPEHLNVDGAKRYTEALVRNVIDSLLVKDTIKN